MQKVPEIRVPNHKPATRNAFDLSSRHNFTAPLGALLPVWCADLMPHDHVEVNVNDFMRAMPMNSAAFVDAKGTYEFFFVPYHQLYSQFDQMITSMNDYHSGYQYKDYSTATVSQVPGIPLWQIISSCWSEGGFDGSRDDFGYPVRLGAARLMDLLGYGKWLKSDGSPEPFLYLHNDPLPSGGPSAPTGILKDVHVNPFRLLAYQKIYFDIYRNTIYENVKVDAFNIDNIKDSGTIVINPEMFKLRYRNYGLDLLTNVRPDAYFRPFVGTGYLFPVGTASSHDVDQDSRFGAVISTDDSSFSVSDIRAAFAIDKLMDYMNRAPKTYADQMRAIFGVDVPVGRDHKVQYVGGFDSHYQIGDVTQVVDTTPDAGSNGYSNYLGSTTGKMIGSGSGSIKFDASEHGVLMCIYSVIPTSSYDSRRIDPFNLKRKRTDYYLPMFDHLGLQPLYESSVRFDIEDALNKPLGWQPRYSEYKTALDVNHGQFVSGNPLSYWTAVRSRGLTSTWLEQGVNLSVLKVNPNLFDSIFSVNYNGKESTDPFFGSVYFNVVKVSDMDVDSMPNV